MAVICSIHGLPNNQWGYCSRCETDPKISIRKCSQCGRSYAIISSSTLLVCGDCAKKAVLDYIRDKKQSVKPSGNSLTTSKETSGCLLAFIVVSGLFIISFLIILT